MSGSGFDVAEADATAAAVLAGTVLSREDRTPHAEQAACWTLAQIGTMFKPLPGYRHSSETGAAGDAETGEESLHDTTDDDSRPGTAERRAERGAKRRGGAFSGSRTPQAPQPGAGEEKPRRRRKRQVQYDTSVAVQVIAGGPGLVRFFSTGPGAFNGDPRAFRMAVKARLADTHLSAFEGAFLAATSLASFDRSTVPKLLSAGFLETASVFALSFLDSVPVLVRA